MKGAKKSSIYGGAFLLSDRAAADRAAATVWEFSARERAIVASLSAGEHGGDTQNSHPERSRVSGAVEGSFDPFDLETLMNLPKEAT